uniref:Uncharacterized protein n=1 Tax=Wuchereria bancrofti TaxID=6293 RepID=A0AAF5RTS6_WUCBA
MCRGENDIFNVRTECATDGPIKTDDLHHLREMRKTVLLQQSIGGPHGVGDPNDRSLRRLEADVLIPNRMNEQVQKVECREPLEGWIPLSGAMSKKEGSFIGMRKCWKELECYETCQLAN